VTELSEEQAEAHGHHHADVSGGWLRAATFGAMDGLVTNISLIAGVGGAGVSSSTLVLTGVAGLVAGAISMSIGEYTSVQTHNEQINAEVEKERAELIRNPLGEQAELAGMWRARGLSAELAERVAAELSRDTEAALRIHAQEELGVDPAESPSPWLAAWSSFICFAVGAAVPLLPYLLGFPVLWVALGLGGLGLFGAGVLMSRFTSRSWLIGGGRQLLLGSLAAGVTYLVGALIGVETG
jgi:VIT1/CCC1 family predicted Fe2+/Mn2+ transporter